MTKYEELIDEYENDCLVEEQSMLNAGLYSDNIIWINKDLTDCEKVSILAEELGHYHTTCGNILNLNDMENAKQEHKARVWAYSHLLNTDMILEAVSKGCYEIFDIAEYVGVSEQFLREYLIYIGWIDC